MICHEVVLKLGARFEKYDNLYSLKQIKFFLIQL